MHYYIDGYNLLFRILHSGEDLRTQRESLINDLQNKNKLLRLPLTLVFDSHFQPEVSIRTSLDNLKIVYTAKGQTADEFILNELKETSRSPQHTVVTSDKKLAWLCRRRLAKTETVEEFITWLNKRYKNKLRIQKPLKIVSAPPSPIPLAPKTQIPSKEEGAETCFDYYLEAFEKLNTIQELENQKVPSPKTPRKTFKNKDEKSVQPKENPLLSDFQRWLQAFDRKDEG